MNIISEIMSQLVSNNIIPLELILSILYKYNGLISPTGHIIKNYIKNYNNINHCWFCRRKQISLSKCDVSYGLHNRIYEYQKYLLETTSPKTNLFICWTCAH